MLCYAALQIYITLMSIVLFSISISGVRLLAGHVESGLHVCKHGKSASKCMMGDWLKVLSMSS